MDAAAGLHAGLLIDAEHVVVVAEGFAVPHAHVEVQRASGPPGEVGIAGEDPGAVLPRFERIAGQPPAHG